MCYEIRKDCILDTKKVIIIQSSYGVQYIVREMKMMRVYSKDYLYDVVENQGKLFDFIAQSFPNMDPKELWTYFMKREYYVLKPGKAINGFMPNWVGEFYAYYQGYYNIPSSDVIKKVPLEFLKKAYYGLHDLEFDLEVERVGKE